jgi:hypothetical protein
VLSHIRSEAVEAVETVSITPRNQFGGTNERIYVNNGYADRAIELHSALTGSCNARAW